jgi:hypothetical protein
MDFMPDAPISSAPPTATDRQADTQGSREAELQSQLDQARAEAQLTLEQLQRVQEELEHYFLAHEEAAAKLERFGEEQRRAEALIDALLARIEARGS